MNMKTSLLVFQQMLLWSTLSATGCSCCVVTSLWSASPSFTLPSQHLFVPLSRPTQHFLQEVLLSPLLCSEGILGNTEHRSPSLTVEALVSLPTPRYSTSWTQLLQCLTQTGGQHIKDKNTHDSITGIYQFVFALT